MATKLMAPHDPSAQIAQEVQHLFETKTIEDMRKIESTTRKEVEDKRQELRKLIGARYRDLIESADSIGTMKQNADLLLSCISSMTNKRRGQDTASPWNPKVQTASETASMMKKQRQYSLGCKIKTVLETPESIWAALQLNSSLEATLRFHQAQLLHANISADPEALLLFTSMPVATRQWNLVGQFPAKINAASKAFLARPDQPPEQYASTLCALALLNKPAPSQILSEFLSSRTQLLDSLSQAASTSKSKDSIVQSLGNYLAAIAHTFFLIYYIFTCPTAQPNSSVKTTKTKSDSIEIKRGQLHSSIPPTAPYFYSTLQNIRDDLDAIYKKHSIENHEDAGSAAFFSLHIPSTSISTQIEQWLVGNTQKFHTLATQLLTHVVGAQSLAQVRDNVKTKIEDTVTTRDIPWATVSQSVAGREINLWELLCTDVFLTRAREIVAHSFETVDFESALTVILKTPSLSVGSGLWTAESARDDKDVATIQNKAAGLTPGVSEFVRKFDTMLATCLSDLTHLTQTIDPTPSSPSPIPPPSPSLRPPPSPRILQSPMKTTQVVAIPVVNPLEVYVQDRCFAGVTSFLGIVRKRLEVLQASILAAHPSAFKTISITTVTLTTPTTPEEEETRKQVDESLLISQAARALGAYSKQLAAALVPQAPATPNGPTPSTPIRKARPQTDKGDETANARLISIKKTLRQCYLHGYVLWAKWVTATHVHWLASCVNRDSWGDSTRRQGWEEHKVVIEGDDGTPVEEKLYLPYQPSPYVLEFLFAVCREIHRAGGHTIHRVALEYLARELATAVLGLYDSVALALQGGGASKEGGVQLLCDACFLIDVLSVPDHSMQSDEDLRAVLSSINPTDAGDSPSSTEGRWVQAMAWGRHVDKTVDTLKELLDPIDLAFYEAHVKSFVTRCYQRSSVLFGALIQLHRSQDSQTKATPVTDPNIIPLARPTARFGYLPTSVPAPSMMTPTKANQPSSSNLASYSNNNNNKEGKKALSFMEQTTGSLKKGFTSLNMLSSTFTSLSTTPPATSPQPSHAGANASTTPPKTSWFL